ncbi:MAG TPA: protein kinase, partial [Xanthomonadales bacterium]|nr:protein kinase [Xanthomonadales bacterium]
MRLEPGTQFAGYTVESRLGRGGMATVYLVREAGLNRHVALKVLPEHLVDDQEFAGRFEQEAQVIAGLDHPNIIPLYRFGITNDVPWMALRYVDGGDFAHRLTDRPLAVHDGLAILRSVAAALDYAHRKGVIHRDLKPQNILLTRDGAPYLADFGVAKLLEGAGRMKTATGGILGTPAYMAPEQAQGFKLGPYTDIYALAIIAFQWLTGRLPFDADTPHAILMKQVTEPVPETGMETLATGVAAVLRRGLAKQPEQRYQSASAFVADLEQALYAPSDATAPLRAATAPAAPRVVPVAGPIARDVPVPPSAPLPQGSGAPTPSPRRNFIVPVAFATLVLAFGSYVVWRELKEPKAPILPAPMEQVTAQPQQADPRLLNPQQVKPPQVNPQQADPGQMQKITPPPVPDKLAPPPPEPAAPAGPTVDTVVAQHLDAIGGVARIRALRTIRFEGQLSTAQGTVQVVTEIKRPGRVVVEMATTGFWLATGHDGRSAWVRSVINGVPASVPVSPGDARNLEYLAELDGLFLDWRKRDRTVTYRGTQFVNGVDAHVLDVRHASGDRHVAYIHPESSLLMRVEAYIVGVPIDRFTDYSD